MVSNNPIIEREFASLHALRATDISFQIRTGRTYLQIIAQINLTLARREVVGILGPNGCGKTTLLRLLARLESPTGGTVDYTNDPTTLGMVFQHVQQNLVPWRTAIDNVSISSILAKDDRIESTENAKTILRNMGLEDLMERYPHELSGGQQQLISLARWLANPPSILLVDEGWGMLDLVQRQRAYSIIRDLAIKENSAVCVVSHNISELAGVADRVLVLTERPVRLATEVILASEKSLTKRTELLWKAAQDTFNTSSTA